MVGATWPSALLAVVFSACEKELAKNVCRPDTQNVAGYKEFIEAMEQAIRGWCTEGRRRSKLVRFVIRARIGKSRGQLAILETCLCRQQHTMCARRTSAPACGDACCRVF